MAGKITIVETNLKFEEVLSRVFCRFQCVCDQNSNEVFDWGSTKTHPFFRNPGIAKVLAVERDVKSRNMKFGKLDRGKGGGGGVFVQINTIIL